MKKFVERELFLGTKDELIDIVLENIKNNQKKMYYALNPDCMLKYWQDEDYRKIINQKENLIYVDGMGIIFSQRFLKLPVAKERIATTDLFPALIKEIDKRQEQTRVFLLGSKGDTAERVKETFKLKYPNVHFVGAHHGYFDKNKESEKIIYLINRSKADVLFVGFGNPVQEKWVEEHSSEINATSIITCGGLFDYYSNNVKRAPLFMQRMGIEWLFRLRQEPRRLYKRYIFGNFKYLMKIATLKLIK